MGSVWLARFAGKHGFEKQVAIKTILPEFAASAQFRTMFLDEARISSRLEHANVAQILDLGEHRSLIYIVFVWVDGSSLEQLCRAAAERGEAVRLGPLLRVMSDACAGLHAAHELVDEAGESLRVVHRDVTPQNIVVSQKGFAKVIDFGVAKARDRLAGETRSGVVKGTPQYMSPEQARGDRVVDRRADVWSAGAVLYRALAGEPPFANRHELQSFILNKRELEPLRETIPKDVRDIVFRAMKRDPIERFATADEMRQAIERAIATSNMRTSMPELFGPPSPQRSSSAPASLSESPTPYEELPFARTSTALPSDLPPPRSSLEGTRPSARPLPKTTRSSRPPSTRSLKLALAIAIAVAVAAIGIAVWVVAAP